MPSTASFWTIINNVYDEASAALRMNLSYAHTHSSGSGSGGQLDWDVIWSDAVHSHGTNTEGGQLVAATAVPNAVEKDTLTTLGDIPYATGSATWSRLAAGSANFVITSNGIGSAASWQAVSAAIASGEYSGNAGTDRALAHSLGKVPSLIRIQDNLNDLRQWIIGGTMYAENAVTGFIYTPSIPDGTSFYVGTGNMVNSANGSGRSYDWVAFG